MEYGKLKIAKPNRSGNDRYDTPPSQWDEIAMPNVVLEDDITDSDIKSLLKEARLQLIKNVHERRKARALKK